MIITNTLLAFLAFFGGDIISSALSSDSEPSISSCLMPHSSSVPIRRII